MVEMPEPQPDGMSWPAVIAVMVGVAMFTGVLLGGVLPMLGLHTSGGAGVGAAAGAVGGLLIGRKLGRKG